MKECFPEQPCSVTLVHKQGSHGTVGTGCFGQAPPLPACMQYVVSYILRPAASGWVQNGSPTPHKTGCKLTLELQLFLFLASSHFHVGIGSFCENGLWRKMYLEKPISLEQGLLLAPSFPLEEFCWNLLYLALRSVEREPRWTARPSCRLTTMLILTALQHAGLHQGLWVPRPVAGGHHDQGSEASGQKLHVPLKGCVYSSVEGEGKGVVLRGLTKLLSPRGG